jgi:hypothetical protein
MSEPFDPTTPRPRPEQAGQEARKGVEDLRTAAREAGTRISEEASATTETLKREGAAMLDDARTQAEGLAKEGARAGADQVGGLARAVHRAADELEQQSPALARTIHEAASAVDGMARQLRGSSPGEMMRSAEDFARRQPLAFFGAAALAGFALARFARSSSPQRGPQARYGMDTAGTSASGPITGPGGMERDTMGTHAGASHAGAHPGALSVGPGAGAPGWTSDDNGTARPATLASASLGGAAAHHPRSDGT